LIFLSAGSFADDLVKINLALTVPKVTGRGFEDDVDGCTRLRDEDNGEDDDGAGIDVNAVGTIGIDGKKLHSSRSMSSKHGAADVVGGK
jgi:hypothetical protein